MKESENTKNSSNAIGKTLTVIAILVGLAAVLFKVHPPPPVDELKETYFDWSTFDWNTFYATLQTHTTTTDWKERPGAKLAEQGASRKFPIIMIPGFTTSGLEVWGSEECGRKYFRTRFWGTMDQAKALIGDQDCWRRHMTLDPYTGSDPSPNIRLRPTEGMVAGDYFMAPYWVWGKLIENFNDVGYDPSSMSMLAFDWRLAFPLVEERDGYFTKVKYAVESFHERHGEKVVIISHSMGGVLVHYFFKWVTTPKEEGGGGGGTDWVEKYIESYVNIAGALLGVPKAVSALLSGEMKDTSMLLGPVGEIAEQYFGRKMRKDMFATWGALWAMLPKGGDVVWNTVPDGQESLPMLTLTDPSTDITDDELKNVSENKVVRKKLMEFASIQNHTASDLVDFLLTWGSGYGPDLSAAKVHKFEKQSDEPITKEHWHDVTVTPLPDAPSTKIYCLYGVGAETEVGYFYKTSWNGYEGDESKCADNRCDPPFLLNTTVKDAERKTAYGVRFGDGDGTVPLLSLGQPCVGGWATKKLNPSGTKVVTREYQDKSVFQVDDPLRGGPESALHVDILGNRKMTEDILRIVTGFEDEKVERQVVSNIDELSKKIEQLLE